MPAIGPIPAVAMERARAACGKLWAAMNAQVCQKGGNASSQPPTADKAQRCRLVAGACAAAAVRPAMRKSGLRARPAGKAPHSSSRVRRSSGTMASS